MIKKLICFIWGHILREEIDMKLEVLPRGQTVKYWRDIWLEKCPRCGARLK